jgi:Tol biopolymer transport system component
MKKVGLAVVVLAGVVALIALPRADAGPEVDSTAQVFVVNSDGSGLRQLTHGGQRKSSPTWSPDARRLAYADGALHVLTLGTGKDRVISRPGHNPAHQSLAWSPRQQELLYGFRTGGDELARANLATLRADGSRFRRLASWRQTRFPLGVPTWSPDGERIAYVRRFDVAVIEPAGNARRTVRLRGDDDEPQWSPNNRSILFVRDGERSGQELWTVSRRGAAPRRIGPPLVSARFPDWSHDGTRVAFTGHAATGEQQALYVLRAERAAASQKIAPEAAESAWSPVGAAIAFADFGGHVKLTAPDGSGQRTLATFPADTDFRHLSWSPDGRRLAFTAQKRPPSS